MKRWGIWVAVLAVMAGGFWAEGCGFRGSDQKSAEPSGHVIAGPGEPGFDRELEQVMELWFRQFALFNSAAVGVGFNEATVEYGNDEAKEILNRYFTQYPAVKDFAEFCAKDSQCHGQYNALVHNPKDPASRGVLKNFGGFGDTGMFGGAALAGDLLRYAVLRDQGYPEEMVEEARARAIHCLEFIDIANSISGVPGVLIRGLRRKDHGPEWTGGVPIPPTPPAPSEPKKGYWREDNTADQRYFNEWGWMDDASKDQLDGWIFAMGAAWDVIAEDPTIPEYYKSQMAIHARNFAHRLMEVAPELGVDMVFRDVEGKLTTWCDFHPNVINFGGCWSAGVSATPLNPFNAIMGLGAIRTMYHVSGDEEIRDYYYNELIGNRRWHEFVRDSAMPITDMNYATNYSNVNMAFMAFYNALRYETDPEVRSVLQQGLERIWDNGKNLRQPKQINQSFFDFIYAGLRAGGNVPGEAAEGMDTLLQWPFPPPLWAAPVINCDDAELLQCWCRAELDQTIIIELPCLHDPDLYQYYLRDMNGNIIKEMGFGHNNTIVAEQVVPRKLRTPSNYDWRSDPFEPNRGGRGSNPYELEAVGDIIPAYWLGRFLKGGAGDGRNVSPVGRVPLAPEPASGLMAAALSESQIDLAWTDATNLEDGFIIERKSAAASNFQELARVARDVTAYTDLNLAPLTTYLYRVVAVNDVGLSGPSNLAPATTFPRTSAPPTAAGNLVATALDHSRIKLVWQDQSNNELGFKIIREDIGALAVTTAKVTEFVDTALDDDTIYRYMVLAYNSAGDAWPSNIAEAKTDKLPSIFAVSPLEEEQMVSIYIGELKVGFGDPVLEGDVNLVVSDEVGPINGTWSLDISGTLLTFIPDPLLLTMSTQYTVTITVDPVLYEYSFYTAGPSWTVDLAASVGKAFAMNIFNAEFVEPVALRDLLQGLDLNAFLLIGVLNADVGLEQIKVIGALGDLDGPDPSQQDMDQPSLLFPQPADLSQNPAWELGPFDFPIGIEGVEVTIEETRLSGIFEKDYSYTGKGEFQGDLDLGLVAGLVGLDPDEICAIVGGCLPCPAEPGRVECVHLYIRNMRAELKPEPIVPIAAVKAKDLGGSATEHTVEMTLLHPETGDVQPGVELKVTVASGSGTLDGSTVTTATTGADGKAAVILMAPVGDSDELNIDIQSAVPYAWIPATIIARF